MTLILSIRENYVISADCLLSAIQLLSLSLLGMAEPKKECGIE